MKRGAESGAVPELLRGKNLGLFVEADEADEAVQFRRAAVALGARVAHIRPSLSDLSEPQVMRQTARMLGRLYDAIECVGLAPALVAQIRHEAGVPVYAAVSSAEHPTAGLAKQLGDDLSPVDARHLVLLSVLASTIG